MFCQFLFVFIKNIAAQIISLFRPKGSIGKTNQVGGLSAYNYIWVYAETCASFSVTAYISAKTCAESIGDINGFYRYSRKTF